MTKLYCDDDLFFILDFNDYPFDDDLYVYIHKKDKKILSALLCINLIHEDLSNFILTYIKVKVIWYYIKSPSSPDRYIFNYKKQLNDKMHR